MKTDIIMPYICGGLGNQLYFIAQAYIYSKKFNKKLYIKNEKEYGSYGKPRPTYYDTVFHNLEIVDITLNNYNTINENELDIFKEGNIYMNGGYFQKTKYILPYLNEIKTLFTPPSNIMNTINEIINRNNLNTDNDLVVHIRLVDDWTPGDFSNIYKPDELEKVKNYIINELLTTKNNIILLSNNMDMAIDILGLKNNSRIFKCDYPDYAELYIMAQFRRFILSPSTFNIWGIILSNKENKEINIFWDNTLGDYSNYRIDFFEQYKNLFTLMEADSHKSI